MDFVFKLMNPALNIMDCVFKLMNYALKMMDFADRYCVQLDPIGDVPHEGEEVKHLSIKGVNLQPSDLLREGFRSKHWSTMRVLRPTAPKFNPTLADENISAMTLGEMKVMLEPFGGHAGLLEKRDFIERLMNLRDAAAQGGGAEVNLSLNVCIQNDVCVHLKR